MAEKPSEMIDSNSSHRPWKLRYTKQDRKNKNENYPRGTYTMVKVQEKQRKQC